MVSAGVGEGQGRPGAGQRGAGQPQGFEDPAPYLGGVRMPGDAPDDQAEQRVVGVGVRVRAPRGHRRAGHGRADRGGGGDRPRRRAGGPRERRVRGGKGRQVVGEAAGVGEERAQGEDGAVVPVPPHEARQVLLHAVVQRDPSLVGELEDHRRDERLGDAAGPEVVPRPDAGAGGAEGLLAGGGVVACQKGGCRGAPLDDEPGEVGRCGRGVWFAGQARGSRGEQGQHQRGDGQRPEYRHGKGFLPPVTSWPTRTRDHGRSRGEGQ